MPVLCEDDKAVDNAPPGAGPLLLQHRHGAYTAARLHAGRLLDAPDHAARLKESLCVLASSQSPCAWLDASKAAIGAAVDAAMGAPLAAALTAYQQAHGEQHGMLVLIIAPNLVLGETPEDPGNSAGTASCQQAFHNVIYCAPLAQSPLPQPLNVAIMPGHRSPAAAKYCRWAEERRGLEAAKPPGCAEVRRRARRTIWCFDLCIYIARAGNTLKR